jgi:cation transport regulator ChaC
MACLKTVSIERNASPPPSSVLIFAYGSNMDLAQMRERCPNSSLAAFVAEARDWKLCFPRESTKRKGGVGSIEREEGSSVWGVVFSVSERDLRRLDRHEGVFIGSYTRGGLEVHDRGGQAVQTQTYFAARERKQDFVPHEDYIDLYLKGARHFGLPAQYIESLERLKNQAKPIDRHEGYAR